MFYNLKDSIGDIYYYIAILALFLIVSYLAKVIIDNIVLKILRIYVEKTKFEYNNILLKNKFFKKISYIIFIIILNFFKGAIPEYSSIIDKINYIFLVLIFIAVSFSLLTSLSDIINLKYQNKNLPIKTISQVLKMVVVVIGIILIISSLLNQSPAIILSGLGALSALTLLIFKDSILGLVAGIQISINDTVRLGDWIEMSKYNADGTVIDISLNVIKVRNFDNTITNIPSYAFLSDSFKNWRGMQEAGGRRVKRTIHICINSIKFATNSDIEKYRKLDILKKYIDSKDKELNDYNSSKSNPNQRKLTNIGTFRAYIELYLKSNPNIHQTMTQMVRQLEVNEKGLPLEIYSFTNDTNWINYEKIQADIFDHIISIAPYFDIEIFQTPSNDTLKNLLKTK